jgi:hypothetical protein
MQQVPNVIGDKANAAAQRLEASGLTATFRATPDNADLCRVRAQSQNGPVERGTEIVCGLDAASLCPTVTGKLLGDAGIKIDSVGHLTWRPIGETSNQIGACTVTEQDAVSPAEYDTEVLLTVNCPITRAEVSSAALKHARNTVREGGGNYDVHSCEPTGMDDGQCEVLYSNLPNGTTCSATSIVTEEPDTIRTRAENVNCY